MITFLVVGFVLGLRHALEADHIAAVAALATGTTSTRAAVARGAFWGVGHTLTLLAVGGTVIVTGARLSASTTRGFELLVGAMLVAIGLDTIRSWRRRAGADALPGPHLHGDPGRVGSARRALAVGLVHGMAGSAALVVIATQSLRSPQAGFAFAALFGLGSIVGMALMSVLVALPVRLTARLVSGRVGALVLGAAAASIAVGLHLIWSLR